MGRLEAMRYGIASSGINRPAPAPAVQTQVQPQPGKVAIKPGAANVTTGSVNQYANVGLRGINTNQGYDEKGRPIRNQYGSVLGADGRVRPAFSLANQIGPSIQLGQEGFNQIRQNALQQGPSAWAGLMNQQQGLEQQNLMNQNARMQASAQNQAFNNLRSRGGLSAGQRERLAMLGQRNAANATQGILNQGMNQRLNIGLQDQQRKDQFLSQLPGLELQQANFAQQQRAYGDQARQFDIQNALRDVQGLNSFNSNAFSDAMREWSSQNVANAQASAANSSRPGGLLGGNIIPGIL